MFVQRDQLSQRHGSQPLKQDRVRRSVALEGAMRREPRRCSIRLNFLRSFAKRQRLGLSKYVCQKYVMVPADRVQRLTKRNEVAGDEPGSLVDQLVERVLSIGAGFSPVDGPRLVIHFVPSNVTCLPLLSIVNCCR